MIRTKMAKEVIRWKKTGGGHFHLNGRIIKPGQVFSASVDEIPKAFRDLITPLDEIKSELPTPIDIKTIAYKVVPRGKSKTWFDVLDEQGKEINEKALTKEQAEKLAKDLS